MATQVLSNAKIWLDSMDVSGDMNAIALEQGVDAQDQTTFGADTKIYLPGLKTAKASGAGLVNLGAGLSEEFLSSKLTLFDVPLTVGPTTGADGEPAYSMMAALAALTRLQGAVGDILKFNLEAMASSFELVRGTVVKNGTVVAAGSGTAFNLGASQSPKQTFCILHVLAIAGGGTWTFKVQSDDLAGFASPTDRATFAAVTAKGSQFLIGNLATDIWWRANWSVAGGAGNSITFVMIIGIQ